MPKAKRARVVNFTKVAKKGKEHKAAQISKIQENLATTKYAHVITIQNSSSEILQQVRQTLKPGQLINCKWRLIRVALGQSPESAIEDNIWKLAALVTGDCALLLTNENAKTVKEKLAQHTTPRYALAGTPATETVTLAAGAETFQGFTSSMEPMLRKLGLPTLLKDGQILLIGDYTVCKEGEPLSVNAAKILRHLGHRNADAYQMGKFEMQLKATWDKKSKKVTQASTD
eukprot:Protomagalhaensia_wolfi_Nauph_80__476@NODE_1267_length_1622_cov_400_415666_g976_i0_p1_GENE_NODE_1267_length_1622_cov_400_415666_g976_i0NODE_1267_length_1622_cov_400_415666_g976_i0_p1_ORF_typecomplete_len230_score60_34RL10P_insert/PF17777_1/2_1e19Ribosomal_L10/PF00466_20/7_7e17Ribosomal_L10/PF00466_20/7_7e02Lactamase_B_5/PF14597_6/0_04_NODE_1267_length_1622_cov_400_415666_g976_i07171406